MKDTTKVWLSSNLSWLFGIGTYLILSDDELVLQIPLFVVVLLWWTTITSLALWISFMIDDDEEEDEEDEEEERVEQLSSCIGFTYYPDEDDYE